MKENVGEMNWADEFDIEQKCRKDMSWTQTYNEFRFGDKLMA